MKKIVLAIGLMTSLATLWISCKVESEDITKTEFHSLMSNLADGWSTQNTDLAISSFDTDAIYMEPPNIQYFRGHKELRPYFDELTKKHEMKFHNLWFDEKSQTGAGEFTFSYGKEMANTGIVVVELRNGKIQFWREYQRKGASDFNEYLEIENKDWQWHIGNYPEPTDTLPKN